MVKVAEKMRPHRPVVLVLTVSNVDNIKTDAATTCKVYFRSPSGTTGPCVSRKSSYFGGGTPDTCL